jgi:hypothetical protein
MGATADASALYEGFHHTSFWALGPKEEEKIEHVLRSTEETTSAPATRLTERHCR